MEALIILPQGSNSTELPSVPCITDSSCCTWFKVYPKAKSHRSDSKINRIMLLNYTLKRGCF